MSLAPPNPFDPANIHAAIQAALDRSPVVPAGKSGQFAVLVNQDTLEAEIAMKIGETWTVTGSGGIKRSTGWFAQATAVHTW